MTYALVISDTRRNESFQRYARYLITIAVAIFAGLLCATSLTFLFSTPHTLLLALPRRGHAIVAPSTRASYCPWCTSNPILCARKFLFVVATGRSGSTTVMGMLNGIPGVFLSGENNEEVTRLRELYEARAASRRAIQAATSAAASNETAAVTIANQYEILSVQQWIWEANLPPVFIDPTPAIVGFKEIRWTPEDIAFIQQVCPCSRFVINARRDARKQAESSFYQASATPLQDVERANQRLVAIKRAIVPAERLLTVDLEDFSVVKFNRLASEWLGISCRFRAVIHSNADGSIDPGKQARCMHAR
jgi:hypothetical protein